MKFAAQIGNMYAGCGEGDYTDGFRQATRLAEEYGEEADNIIRELCDALCDRHSDDWVDEFRAKHGLF
jgi:hypothetical protein